MTTGHRSERGIASLELLTAVTLTAITLLSVAAMYLTSHATVERSGETSVAVGLARRVVEDMRSVPYTNLVAFDGFDTDDASTLPADEPQRDILRRFRYAVAGDGAAWPFSIAEIQAWPTFAVQGADARGRIEVASPGGSICAVTVTISIPGLPRDIELATLISRTQP